MASEPATNKPTSPRWRQIIAGDPKRLTVASVALIVIGVLAITVGNLAGWGWTRIIGATLISVGGLGVGALVALIDPRRERVRVAIARRRTTIALVAAVVLVLPVILVLVAALAGLFAGGGGAALRAVGALIAVFLLAVSVASAVIAVRAIRRATLIVTDDTQAQTGEGL